MGSLNLDKTTAILKLLEKYPTRCRRIYLLDKEVHL